MYDVIIVGAGLAGSLAAKRLLDRKVNFLLIDSNSTLGGHHTWSFHWSDLTPDTQEWMKPLVSHQWSEHRVSFPRLSRTLPTPYCTILSSDFDEKLRPQLGERFRSRTKVTDLTKTSVRLETGEVLQSKLVLDARGWSPQGIVAYQKFVGLEVELETTCDLTSPFLMDATVPQIDGFRFLYTLPFSRTRILIEDTYYSNDPELNVPEIESRILAYARENNWAIAAVIRKEVGCLPLPLTATFPLSRRDDLPIPLGLRAGLFHATTGYSLPWAVSTAELLYKLWPTGQVSLESGLKNWIHDNWKDQAFYRLLNRMLFWAAPNKDRYKVLEKFYGLPLSLIERFYAGQNTWWDRARILSGKPPVPVVRAARVALLDRSPT